MLWVSVAVSKLGEIWGLFDSTLKLITSHCLGESVELR